MREDACDFAITSAELTKVYKNKKVVDSLNLQVPRGEIYGFLGPNGSGKSTTMKMLLGLTTPTSGSATVLGGKPGGPQITRVGSMIESPPGYLHLTGRENLEIVRQSLGLSTSQVDKALATVRLTENQNKLVRGPDPLVVDTLKPACRWGSEVPFHHATQDLHRAVQA